MNQSARQFFKANAGISYDPAIETMAQGADRCARKLAAAERKASEAGYFYQWAIDQDIDSSEWSDESPPWATWNCTIRDSSGKLCGSLCGIDFGRDKWGESEVRSDPYARVVQAELALEAIG